MVILQPKEMKQIHGGDGAGARGGFAIGGLVGCCCTPPPPPTTAPNYHLPNSFGY